MMCVNDSNFLRRANDHQILSPINQALMKLNKPLALKAQFKRALGHLNETKIN